MGVGIRKILYATDFSRFAPVGIAYSVALASHFDAELLVFHAMQNARDTLFASDVPSKKGATEEDRALAHIADMMGDTPVRWQPLIVFGDSVENMPPLVENQRIDLVVATSYGLSGLKRVLMGTVIERMARALRCPLLVVRAAGDGTDTRLPQRVVVSSDFSPASRYAITYAARLAVDLDAEMHVLHALEAPLNEDLVEPTQAPYEEVQALLEEHTRDRLRALLEEAAPGVGQSPVELVRGVPGEAISHYARTCGADLLVVGIKPEGRLFQLLKGSTTEALIRKGPCPLLVVPSQPSGNETIPSSGNGEPR